MSCKPDYFHERLWEGRSPGLMPPGPKGILPPQSHLGTFYFQCLKCFNSWDEFGFEDASKDCIKCPKCGNEEIAKHFELFDPDADVDAT